MRISDWSSDVCSSDLLHISRLPHAATQRELAEAVGVRGPTLVRTLDRLEAEGLIERRTEAADRRTQSVNLRAEAAPVLERIEAPAAAVRAEIFSDISHAAVTTRSEESRVGNEGVSTCKYRGTPYT